MSERRIEEIIGWRQLGPYVYLGWSDSNDVGHIRAEVDDLAAWLDAKAEIWNLTSGEGTSWDVVLWDEVILPPAPTIRDALIAAVRKVADHG